MDQQSVTEEPTSSAHTSSEQATSEQPNSTFEHTSSTYPNSEEPLSQNPSSEQQSTSEDSPIQGDLIKYKNPSVRESVIWKVLGEKRIFYDRLIRTKKWLKSQFLRRRGSLPKG